MEIQIDVQLKMEVRDGSASLDTGYSLLLVAD